MEDDKTFSEEVARELGYYVYRLIDPRNGETFYVGKGKGNRVFAHAAAALTAKDSTEDDDDEQSQKLSRIRKIHSAGLEVGTVIHRHGMDEETAYEVEAALIDAYPGLTNAQGGHGSDYGPMHTKEIISKYQATEADLSGYVGSMIIKIRQTRVDECEGSVYEAVRYAWRVHGERAKGVPYVFAAVNGIIRGVYKVGNWYPVTELGNRLAFNGHPAEELEQLFVGKRIPAEYRQRGAASPTLYIRNASSSEVETS